MQSISMDAVYLCVLGPGGPGPRALGPRGPFNRLRLIGKIHKQRRTLYTEVASLFPCIQSIPVFWALGAQGLGPWDPGVHVIRSASFGRTHI